MATITVAALIARRGIGDYLVLPTPSQRCEDRRCGSWCLGHAENITRQICFRTSIRRLRAYLHALLLVERDHALLIDDWWQIFEVPLPLYCGFSICPFRSRTWSGGVRFYSFPGAVRADNNRFVTRSDSDPCGHFHAYLNAGPNAALVNCYVALFIKKDVGGSDRVGYIA